MRDLKIRRCLFLRERQPDREPLPSPFQRVDYADIEDRVEIRIVVFAGQYNSKPSSQDYVCPRVMLIPGAGG